MDRHVSKHISFSEIREKKAEKEGRKEAEKKRKEWLTDVTLKEIENIRTISKRAK